MQKEREIAYQETLDYLYRFVDYSLVKNFRDMPEKFDLNRMRKLLDLLGNPHQQYGVIHVAGTKGKGSTCALIASALRAAGYQVGFYSSPHLQEFTERFQINGEQITPDEIVTLVEELKPVIEQVEDITWFEITTAIGFVWFARQKVNLAVIEVGLGGRLDATNVVDPLVAVITSLSMDHMAVLGDTLAKIAYEKAGIIKPGKPVVLAKQQAEACTVIEQVAAERSSPLVSAPDAYSTSLVAHSLQGQTFRIRPSAEPEGAASEFFIPLLGLHQVENATAAYAALQTARAAGWQVDEAAIVKGFAEVAWPGRFEVLRKSPPLIVDSAHNRDSARRLRQALDDYLPDLPVVLIFGASEDKDISGMLAELMPRVREVITTQSVHPRHMDAAKMAELAQPFGKPAEAIIPVEAALETALERAGHSAAAIVATGSLFVAAAVRNVWQHR